MSAGRDHHERASGAAAGSGTLDTLCPSGGGDNPFIVVLPDIIIDNASADPLRYNWQQWWHVSTKRAAAVLAKRMKGDLSEYSVIQTKEALETEGQVSRIVEFIEKPDQPQTLDSDLMAVGRYVLNADIWAELEKPSGRTGSYPAHRCDCRAGEEAVC